MGCVLNKMNDTAKEVRGIIRAAMVTLMRMRALWSHSNCSIRFKLNVLQTGLFAKILFGLESAELTVHALQAIDAFHLHGLRKIQRIKTTYIGRANKNEEV